MPATPGQSPGRFRAEQIPVRAFDIRARKFRGKLLVARDGNAVELDEVGAFIFKNIDGVSTMDEIAARLAEEYGIPHELALADGTEFVTELLALGILETRG